MRDPFDPAVRRRIEMTVGCRDCDAIPKVAGAGGVFVEDGVRVQRMHNDLKVVADGYDGPWMTEIIRRLHGHHEPQEELAFHRLLGRLRPGSTMVELGCYWAYYSLWFAAAVADARCYLMEPDPDRLRVGRENFRLNGRDGHFTQEAVGPGTFGRYLDRLGDPFVDILHADIQGAELHLIDDIRPDRTRFAVISTHHRLICGHPDVHGDCLAKLAGKGAYILAEHSVAESYSGDGLIVAAFGVDDVDMASIPISRNVAANSLFGD